MPNAPNFDGNIEQVLERDEIYLSRADLSWADLNDVDLSNADLSWACLRRADVSDADLSGADLSNAELSDAYLKGADLSEVDLSWADLCRADLSHADLSGADLTGVNLRNAHLNNADLTDTELNGVDLTGTEITATKLNSEIFASCNDKSNVSENDIYDRLGAVYCEKDKEYGNSIDNLGDMIEILFDGGSPSLETPEDYRDFAYYTRVVEKLVRVGKMRFVNGDCETSVDDMGDIANYSAQLTRLFEESADVKYGEGES